MTDPVPSNAGHGHVFPRPDGVKARCGGPALCPVCKQDLVAKNAQEQVPSKKWDGPREGQAYVLWLEGQVAAYEKFVTGEWFQRVTYKQQARNAQDEVERLKREISRITGEREPPHCSSCSCGMTPEPAGEYPDPVTAFENLAAALPPGFEFPTMDADTSPLTHQEIFSAVLHHANEIVRLTAAVPAQCSDQPPCPAQIQP